MVDVTRSFIHREHGEIGKVVFSAPSGAYKLDGKELPESSVEYLLTFALQNLQDAYAGSKTADEARGAWDKKRAALLDGTIGVRGSGTPADPLGKLVDQLARAAIRKHYAAKGIAYKNFTEKPADEQKALVAKVVEKNREALEKEANAELKRRAAMAKKLNESVDLDDLSL